MMSSPSFIRGRTLSLRLVEEADAEMIVRLRNDERLSAYLSSVPNDVERQRCWITDYKKREQRGEEFYYVIIIADMPCGLVRLYDFAGDSFVWGSLVIEHDNVLNIIEVITLVYRVGFEYLGFARARLNVRRDNSRVLALHRRLGARYTGDQGEDSWFEFFPENYHRLLTRFNFAVEIPATKTLPR